MTLLASPCWFPKKNGWIMPLHQNPHQTVTRFRCIGFSMYACGFSMPKCENFDCLLTRQDQNELHLKRWLLLSKSASSVSRSQAHLVKRKRIGWSIGFSSRANWTLYGVIPRFLCKIRLNDVSEMFNCWERRWIDVDGAWQTHFLPQWQYSRVYALFLDFHALI